MERHVHEWRDDLTAAEVRALYGTYSDHMMLPEPRRSALLDAVAATVEGSGGTLGLRYRTVTYTGTAPE